MDMEHEIKGAGLPACAQVDCKYPVCACVSGGVCAAPSAQQAAGSIDTEEFRHTLKQAVSALEYAAFNYDGAKLENLNPRLVESTGVSETALIAARNLKQLLARPAATPAQPIAPQEPMTTDEAREFLIGFMNEHFTDRTFHRYIRADQVDKSRLAGDFAWQMATALRKIGASPCAMCNGAGSVGHAPDGYSDCPECTAPVAQPIADMSAPTDERAAFEAWARRTHTRPGTHFDRSHNGVYKDNRIAAKWAAWHAARAAAPVSGPTPFMWVNPTDLKRTELTDYADRIEIDASSVKFGHCTMPLYLADAPARDSALEEAANACQIIGKDWKDAGDYAKSHAADYLAKWIIGLKDLSAAPVSGQGASLQELRVLKADLLAAQDCTSMEQIDGLAEKIAARLTRPTDDELWDATLRDRDTYHEWADKLAEGIATHFGIEIGEHSNQNLPWTEALEFIDSRPRSEDSRAEVEQIVRMATAHGENFVAVKKLREALASTTPQKADNE